MGTTHSAVQIATAEVEAYPHGRVPRHIREKQVLALAEELFAEKGFAVASMDELALRAGVSKPVIYDLVGSKEELFKACIARASGELREQIAEAVSHQSEPVSQLRAGSLAFFKFIDEHRQSWSALFVGDVASSFSTEAESVRKQQFDLVAGLLEKATRVIGTQIEYKFLEGTAHAVNGAFEAVAVWWWEHPELPCEVMSEWMVALLVPGLTSLSDFLNIKP
ncbi:MAG: TetR/AcrR family transcriptional regulator [Acidimicrobiales bacterium]|nr:TetR/AcrR family transcriptional regulator [Acidimicrobiales bacterium]